MKNKTMYVCVNTVNHNDGWHIGTLQIHDDIELNEKLKKALESHFDTDIMMLKDQTIESIMYGKKVEFNIEIEDYGIEQIEMFLTFIY
jgi:hypothetical protein